MIRVRGLQKAFNGQTVLGGIDMDVAAGEIVAVMGSSGTGKSVLLLCLIGLMAPDAGEIEINGARVDRLTDRDLLVFRRNVGYLFQDSALFDFMSVSENLAFPLCEHGGLNPAEICQRVGQFLEMVDLQGAADKYPSELSGGMRKRAALARALVTGPKVLLCDEPTSGLDPVRSRDISQLIRRLSQAHKCTTVITSHDVPNALRCADRGIVLHDGHIAVQGVEAELRACTDPFVKSFLE